jgi:Putative MetA-pathway of phenol degradation
VTRLAGFVVVLTLGLMPSPSAAQSVSDVLSFLLTNRAVQTDDFQRDAAAAAATRDTVTALLGAELATLPPSLSSAGFTYRFNSMLGTAERASMSFGSFFTERSLTSGKGQATLGVNVRMASYDRLDGRDLREGAFLTTANQFRDEAEPFDVETLTLDIDSRVLTFTGTYGLTDRFDISAAVPMVQLSMNGTRVNTYRGRQVVQAVAEATSRGLGDVVVRGKYGLLNGPSNGLALAGEVRLPTGREDDLLGAGTTAFSALLIASSEHGPMGYHGNLSLSGGGLSSELAYRGAVCVSASDRVTLVGELVGRRYGDVGRITDVRVPHPTIGNVDTIRLIPEDSSLSTAAVVVGAKWNVNSTWILSGHTQLPISDRGLRSGVVTLIALDYAFEM